MPKAFKPFSLSTFSSFDKSLIILGEDLTIYVDYDDVDHDTVRRATKKLVRVLNKHWEDAKS